jgi:hypothetical protein
MNYDKTYYKGNAQDCDRPVLPLYERLWKKYCGGGPVLDFGSGVGYFAKRLTCYTTVYTLESNTLAREQSQRNAPLPQSVESLRDLQSGSLGAVTA